MAKMGPITVMVEYIANDLTGDDAYEYACRRFSEVQRENMILKAHIDNNIKHTYHDSGQRTVRKLNANGTYTPGVCGLCSEDKHHYNHLTAKEIVADKIRELERESDDH